MEKNMDNIEIVARWGLSIGLLVVGLVFLALGVTIFPVFGIFLGIAFIGLAFTPGMREPYERAIRILVGRHSGQAATSGNVIPVAILSTSKKKGDAFDFDATTVDPASVRFGPNQAAPVSSFGDPGGGRLREGNTGTDLVFYFPLDEAGITAETEDVCITAKTVKGETVQGCTALPPI